MDIFEWAILGAAGLGILVFCARLMKSGITTLDDNRKKFLGKIESTEKTLAEDRKNISAYEHIEVVKAALTDLLRLDGNRPGYSIRNSDKKIELVTPQGVWTIELVMNERTLKSTHKVLHGRSRWFLSGFGNYEHHSDPRSLLKSVNEHLHSNIQKQVQPEHLARRLRGIRGARVHTQL